MKIPTTRLTRDPKVMLDQDFTKGQNLLFLEKISEVQSLQATSLLVSFEDSVYDSTV